MRKGLVIPLFALLLGGTLFTLRKPLIDNARRVRDHWQRPQGPPAAPASVQAPGPGMLTDDPPPFDRQMSTIAFRLPNGRTIRPNLHFDLEDSHDTTLLSALQAHGGRRALRLSPTEEYSPAIKREVQDVADTLAAIAVGCWLRAEHPDPRVNIVMTVDRNGQQLLWSGKELKGSEHVPGTWERYQAELLIREHRLLPTDRISIYWWNREQVEVFVDDVDIVFRSTSVPGLSGVPRYDLEAEGKVPPPMAKVLYVERVDAASQGIVPGAPAPMQAPVRIDLPNGEVLHHAPGDAVARLVHADGSTKAFVRLWTRECAADLLGFERAFLRPTTDGIIAVGYDIDGEGDAAGVAHAPAPIAARVRIELP